MIDTAARNAPTPRQEELVDQAVALLRESGLGGLTVRRLAERMGFSEAALYRHFPSKHALLLAIVDRTQERFLGPIRDLAARPGPVEERLKEVLRHHVGLILDTDGMPFLFVAEATATGDEQLLARLRLVLSAYFGLLGDLLAELPPSPTRPAPRDLTLLLFGLAAATAVRLRVTGERPTGSEVEALVDFLVRQILAG